MHEEFLQTFGYRLLGWWLGRGKDEIEGRADDTEVVLETFLRKRENGNVADLS